MGHQADKYSLPDLKANMYMHISLVQIYLFHSALLEGTLNESSKNNQM